LDFLEAVQAEKSRIAEELSITSRRHAYVARSMYSAQIERVFRFFPRNQVLFIKYEDFRACHKNCLDSIFCFLDLRRLVGVRNKRRNVVPYERPIASSERRNLSLLFEEDISRVEQLLGWDCSDWRL
jgi:hypothetical protein